MLAHFQRIFMYELSMSFMKHIKMYININKNKNISGEQSIDNDHIPDFKNIKIVKYNYKNFKSIIFL